MKWAFAFSVALSLWSIYSSPSILKALPIGYMGAMLMGFLLVWFWNKNNKQTFY
jgi:hypothetical protein